ncbi:MAG: hypothetical protein ABI142_05195, partial [Bryocella sp.]
DLWSQKYFWYVLSAFLIVHACVWFTVLRSTTNISQLGYWIRIFGFIEMIAVVFYFDRSNKVLRRKDSTQGIDRL